MRQGWGPRQGSGRWLRLNPRLRLNPGQRRPLWAVAPLLVILIALAGYGYATTRDRTKGMHPEQVVKAAGMALANASAFRFTVELTGETPDGSFPTVQMQGEYRREPPLLHLSGEVGSNGAGTGAVGPSQSGDVGSGATGANGAGSPEAKVPLEYYVEGTVLFVKEPRTGRWLRFAKPNLDELQAFQPARLAVPLISGLRSAVVVGRERLSGREALVLKLDLDSGLMRILPPGEEGRIDYGRIDYGRVDYRLWVHTSTLRPLAFAVSVSRQGDDQGGDQGGGEANRYSSTFQYRITWDYSGPGRISVPASIREQTVVR